MKETFDLTSADKVFMWRYGLDAEKMSGCSVNVIKLSPRPRR